MALEARDFLNLLVEKVAIYNRRRCSLRAGRSWLVIGGSRRTEMAGDMGSSGGSRSEYNGQLLTGLRQREACQWYDYYAPWVISTQIMVPRVFLMFHEFISRKLMRWQSR